jgi:hypothetical protein
MSLADELLTAVADRELPRLDEKLYLDVFGQTGGAPSRWPSGAPAVRLR